MVLIDRSGAGLFRDIFGRVHPSSDYHILTSIFRKNTSTRFPSFKDTSILEATEAMSNIAHKSNFIRLDNDDPSIVTSKVYTSESTSYVGELEETLFENKINKFMYVDDNNRDFIIKQLDLDRVLRSSDFYEANSYPVHNFDLLEDTSNRHNDKIFYDKLINVSNHRSFPYIHIGPTYMTSPNSIPILTLNYKSKATGLQINNIRITADESKYGGLFKLLKVKYNEYKSVGSDPILSVMFMVNDHIRTIRRHAYTDNTYENKEIEVYIPKTIITIEYQFNIEQIHHSNRYILSTNVETKRQLLDHIGMNGYNFFIIYMPLCNRMNLLSFFERDAICFICDCIINKHSTYSTRWTGISNLISSLKYVYAGGASTVIPSNLTKVEAVMYMINRGLLQPWSFGNVYNNSSNFYPCMHTTNMTRLPFSLYNVINNDYTIDLIDAIYGFYIDFFESIFNSDMYLFPFIEKSEYDRYLDWRKDNVSDMDNYLRKIIVPMIRSIKISNYKN